MASTLIRSTKSDFPVPGAGDVKAVSGAVAIDRRSSTVSIAATATARSAMVTNGNVSINLRSCSRAASASALLGYCGTGGKTWSSGLNSRRLSGS